MDKIINEIKNLNNYLEQLDNIQPEYNEKFKDYSIEKLEKKIIKTENIEKQIKYYQHLLYLIQ